MRVIRVVGLVPKLGMWWFENSALLRRNSDVKSYAHVVKTELESCYI